MPWSSWDAPLVEAWQVITTCVEGLRAELLETNPSSHHPQGRGSTILLAGHSLGATVLGTGLAHFRPLQRLVADVSTHTHVVRVALLTPGHLLPHAKKIRTAASSHLPAAEAAPDEVSDFTDVNGSAIFPITCSGAVYSSFWGAGFKCLVASLTHTHCSVASCLAGADKSMEAHPVGDALSAQHAGSSGCIWISGMQDPLTEMHAKFSQQIGSAGHGLVAVDGDHRSAPSTVVPLLCQWCDMPLGNRLSLTGHA